MKFLLILLTVALTSTAHATPQRLIRDLKLPSQVMLEHDLFTTPIVATTNQILTTNAGPTSTAAVTVSSFTHQPDVPRNITITPTGTTGDVEACAIVVTGTNVKGATISETLTFLADASTAQTGSKAFATVTSVLWPANCESGGFAATWIIGVGSKLGLNHCVAAAGNIFKANFNGANETIGTTAVSATAVESNTYITTGTMDGTKNSDLYYVQNYQCL